MGYVWIILHQVNNNTINGWAIELQGMNFLERKQKGTGIEQASPGG
jgi:hypothetical protein